jgi:hypothetical protein
MDDKDSINLMPEDLRHKEADVKSKAKTSAAQPDLNVPGDFDIPQDKPLSGSKGKSSWLSKFKKPKAAKPVEDMEIDTPPTKNGFKPLPIVAKSAAKPAVKPAAPVLAPKAKPVPPAAKNQQGFELNNKEVSKEKFHQPGKRIRARFVEDGMGVDLVPTSAKVKSWKQVSVFIAVAFLGSVGLIVIIYFGLLTMNTSLNSTRVNALGDIAQIDASFLKFEESSYKINQTGQEIALIYDLLNKHVYWTNFFELLEKYTISDVHYLGFSAGNNGALTLEAVAPSYYSVAKQLKILQQDEAVEFVTAVDISSASLAEGGVTFSISLVLNPNLFYYQVEE